MIYSYLRQHPGSGLRAKPSRFESLPYCLTSCLILGKLFSPCVPSVIVLLKQYLLCKVVIGAYDLLYGKPLEQIMALHVITTVIICQCNLIFDVKIKHVLIRYIHSFIPEIFIELLLHMRHCSKHLVYNNNKTKSLPCGTYYLVQADDRQTDRYIHIYKQTNKPYHVGGDECCKKKSVRMTGIVNQDVGLTTTSGTIREGLRGKVTVQSDTKGSEVSITQIPLVKAICKYISV